MIPGMYPRYPNQSTIIYVDEDIPLPTQLYPTHITPPATYTQSPKSITGGAMPSIQTVPALTGQVTPEQLAAWTLSWIKQIYPLDSEEITRYLDIINTTITGSVQPRSTPAPLQKLVRAPKVEPPKERPIPKRPTPPTTDVPSTNLKPPTVS
jgi:hypothetical protein